MCPILKWSHKIVIPFCSLLFLSCYSLFIASQRMLTSFFFFWGGWWSGSSTQHAPRRVSSTRQIYKFPAVSAYVWSDSTQSTKNASLWICFWSVVKRRRQTRVPQAPCPWWDSRRLSRQKISKWWQVICRRSDCWHINSKILTSPSSSPVCRRPKSGVMERWS